MDNIKTIKTILFHRFKVKLIKINNSKVDFNQHEDTISIQLNDYMKKNTLIDLFIEYEGISPQRFFVGERAVFLPASFAWLPFHRYFLRQ